MSIDCEDTNTQITNLKEYIEIIAKREGLLTYEYDIQKINTDGGNFLGDIIEVGIKGKTVHGVKQVNIFVKSKLSCGDNLKLLSIHELYSKELYAYKELSNIYDQLQEEANIPFEDRYKFVKCYDESNADIIIMEDIAKLGYVTYDRYEIIPIDFARKCIKQLAKFHALSFVLEEKKMDYFNNKIKHLKHPLIYNEQFVTYINNMYKASLNHLKGEYKDKMESVSDVCQKYYNYLHNATGIKCLCHGDYKTLNIMMKYTKGELSDIMPLDYQFVYYGSPIIDFMYFIFGSTDREFRSQHLETLKDLYHDTMKDFFNHFEMDINLYYPRDEFYKAYNERLEFGLIFSMWHLPLTLAEKDEALDLNNTSLANITFSVNERVKSRLKDVIDDFTDWGFFK